MRFDGEIMEILATYDLTGDQFLIESFVRDANAVGDVGEFEFSQRVDGAGLAEPVGFDETLGRVNRLAP